MQIGEFRDRASELIRRAAGGETIVIINRNREVAKVVPITAKADRPGGLVGCLAGTAEVPGDIERPIASPRAWFPYIFFLEIRQLRDDLSRRQPVCHEIHDVRHGDAQTPDCRAPSEDVRVLRDAIESLFHERLEPLMSL